MWEYYSKWRKKWVAFKKPPTPGQIFSLKKYGYLIRKDGKPVADGLIVEKFENKYGW